MTIDLDALAREIVLSACRKVTGMVSEDADLRVVTTEALVTELRATLDRVRAASLAEGAAAERERCAKIALAHECDHPKVHKGPAMPGLMAMGSKTQLCRELISDAIRAPEPGEGR